MNLKRVVAASVLSLAAGAAMAQYPTKPVTVIVPPLRMAPPTSV